MEAICIKKLWDKWAENKDCKLKEMARAEHLWNNAEEESYEYWRMTRLTDIIKYYNPASNDLDKAVLYNCFRHKYSY